MRSVTSTWFECKVRYEQLQENGMQKRVTEQYVVDAMTFTEAEAKITEEMGSLISGEFEITDIGKAAYAEVFFRDTPSDEAGWYKARLDFITLDEKTGKEKHCAIDYLVQAVSLREAIDNIDSVMKGSMVDYKQANVGETKILDVFEKTVI